MLQLLCEALILRRSSIYKIWRILVQQIITYVPIHTYNAAIKAIAKSGCTDAPFQIKALLLRMLKISQDGYSNN